MTQKPNVRNVVEKLLVVSRRLIIRISCLFRVSGFGFRILLCLVVLACGCRSWQMYRSQPPPNVSLAAPRVAVAGKVVSVRLAGNFVVIDFGGGAVPPAGTQLSVFHEEVKVGRVQMTEPSYPPFGAANILEGLLEVGDTVR